MERYQVTRKGAVVEAIASALLKSGAKIISEPNPALAPFEYTVLLPDGDLVELVCYAFTANKYRQRQRPTDEHRFQVKYGTDFKRYHELYIDPLGKKVTLFFGVHLAEQLFVAVDPTAHNPTWFSKSIEFKDEHVREIKKRGWFGWERVRVKTGRRKIDLGDESFTTEAMLGFRPQHFARYIKAERTTSSLPPSERLAFVEAFEPGKQPSNLDVAHVLEIAFGLSAREILDLIASQRRVLMNVRGSIAELHLHKHLRSIKKLSKVLHPDRDAPPDFEVLFQRRTYGIECKNLLRDSKRRPKVDFQRTRAPKGNPCGRYYSPESFQVLAACMEAATGRWEFNFCPTHVLRPHEKCGGRISPNIYLDEAAEWTPDVLEALGSTR